MAGGGDTGSRRKFSRREDELQRESSGHWVALCMRIENTFLVRFRPILGLYLGENVLLPSNASDFALMLNCLIHVWPFGDKFECMCVYL